MTADFPILHHAAPEPNWPLTPRERATRRLWEQQRLARAGNWLAVHILANMAALANEPGLERIGEAAKREAELLAARPAQVSAQDCRE